MAASLIWRVLAGCPQNSKAADADDEIRGAIVPLERAYSILAGIPSGRMVQGLCASHLARAYAQLGDDNQGMKYAREALRLVSGIDRMKLTEATANLTLGICLYRTGDAGVGRTRSHLARQLARNWPGGQEILTIVDHNEAVFERQVQSRWWRFWKRS